MNLLLNNLDCTLDSTVEAFFRDSLSRLLCCSMVVDETYWLDQIQPSHRSLVGDKAFYLSLLAQNSYPVVPGFVIPVSAFQAFLTQVHWEGQMYADLPHSFLYVDTNNSRQLQAVAQQIRQAILATPLPESLLETLQHHTLGWKSAAVVFRPSFCLQSGLDPTMSSKSAGLLQSQICCPNLDALAQSLKRVWAELFRARSLFYWQHMGIQLQQVQLAVLVQPMESVMAAGEMVVTESHLQIQATWGLGHGLSEGDSVADRYAIHLPSGMPHQQIRRKLHAYHVTPSQADYPASSTWLTSTQCCLYLSPVPVEHQSQSVLTSEQLQQLVQFGQRIQSELNMPLKLEWTLARSNPATDVETTPPAFQFTQLTPQFSGRSYSPMVREPSNPASPVLLPRASPLQSSQFPASHFQTGLAAAPGRAIATAWVLDTNRVDFRTVPAGVIVVTTSVTPEQVIGLQQVAGLLTEQGGMTSHAAILARELGIPAVVGVAQITRLIQTGDRVALDGDQGVVYYGDIDPTTAWQTAQMDTPPPLANPQHPATPRKAQLWVTLSQPTRLAQMAALPVDGVGLLRSELLLLELLAQTHPLSWLKRNSRVAVAQIKAQILPFVAAFSPRPVFYRTLDLRSHEFTGKPSAPAPMLGIRGSFSYQVEPEWFQTELAALKQLQQEGYSNLRLVLPFVRTVEEFVFCRQQVERVGLPQDPGFQIWIMAEVPSVLMLLPDYVAAGVQGITIGTNDLTQLLLGVDRDQPRMADAFNPYHPAILRAIQQLVQTAQQLGIPCCICGQMLARHPDFIHSLIEWGITAISVEPHEWEAVDREL